MAWSTVFHYKEHSQLAHQKGEREWILDQDNEVWNGKVTKTRTINSTLKPHMAVRNVNK